MLPDLSPSLHDQMSDANVVVQGLPDESESWFEFLENVYACEEPLTESELQILAHVNGSIPAIAPITTPVMRIDPAMFDRKPAA